MIIKQIKKTIIAAFLLAVSAPVAGQDLLARQAPVDRKMKAVDSFVIHRLASPELFFESNDEIYEDWDNFHAHSSQALLPDSFMIDLRDFCMPTPSRLITSNFGPRWGRSHKGLDIKVYIGDTIRAAFGGKVRVVKNDGRRGYGKYIVIRHNNGLETYYGHLSKQLVNVDQVVNAGDVIGLGGNTGRSTGSHLHFETRLSGVALHPALMFDFINQDVTGDSYVFRKKTYERECSLARKRLEAMRAGKAEDMDLGDLAIAEAADEEVEETATPMKAVRGNRGYYKVRRGDTLSAIARKRGLTVRQLCKLNRINTRTKIRPGQILRTS